MAQHINEPRRNQKAGRINDALGGGSVEFADRCNAVAADGEVAGGPRIARAINDFAILDDYVVGGTRLHWRLGEQRRVVRSRGDFAQGFAHNLLRRFRIIRSHRHHVGIQRKCEMLPIRGFHVSG